jgi:uncharacterized protein
MGHAREVKEKAMTTPETPKSTPTTADDLFDFPCDFPIKVMGKAHPEFHDAIVTVIREYDGEFDVTRIETRPSSGGNYTGLTITVRAQSRAHLDDIYRALTGHPMVKIVL